MDRLQPLLLAAPVAGRPTGLMAGIVVRGEFHGGPCRPTMTVISNAEDSTEERFGLFKPAHFVGAVFAAAFFEGLVQIFHQFALVLRELDGSFH